MSVRKEFALLFAVLFLPGIVTQWGPVDAEAFSRLSYHLLVMVVSVPQILLVLYVSDLRVPGSSRRFGWTRPRVADAVVAGGTYAAVIMIAIAVSAVAATLARWLPEIETAVTPAVQWRFTKPALIPAALISSLCIGYREEVFFRAYLFDRASEVGIRPVGAITGGSLLFAVGHIYQGVAGFLVASLLGLILGAIYWRRKSLHGVAVAHALYNLSVLLISGPFAGQVG